MRIRSLSGKYNQYEDLMGYLRYPLAFMVSHKLAFILSLSVMYGILLGCFTTMKRNRFLMLLVLCVLILGGFRVFSQADVIDQVKESIKTGSAKELSKYFNQTVDVTIEGKVENYSKAQAEFVLRDFFKAHPPSEFNIIHQGSSKGGQPFAIGQYKSGSDAYRVWMKIKTVGKEQLIQEISFVKE
jgi:hypothetical protein